MLLAEIKIYIFIINFVCLNGIIYKRKEESKCRVISIRVFFDSPFNLIIRIIYITFLTFYSD
jgi:hypothetical protein